MHRFFFVGLGLGIAAGVLCATQSGEKTRELISEEAAEGRRYAEETAQNIRDRASVRFEAGKEAVRQQRKAVVAAAEAAKHTYNREAQTPSQGLSEETIISDPDSKRASA